jgi:fructosamine-3-kinase
VEGKAESASHPAAVLSDGLYAVFVKLREGAAGRDQLEQELAGLATLSERAGVLTPLPLGTEEVQGGTLAITGAVETVRREARHWRQMGRALATIHRVKSDRFGYPTHGYWGDLYQDNSQLDDWAEFFWRRRVEPRLHAAIGSGHLPERVGAQVESLRSRLAGLCGPAVAPALLHGDAHQNNFLSTARGPFVIDPAVYYGHPEVDLAAVDFFSPVPHDFFRGYAEIAPIDPRFSRRRDLWRLPAWLAMVEVEGPRHLESLSAALRSCR